MTEFDQTTEADESVMTSQEARVDGDAPSESPEAPAAIRGAGRTRILTRPRNLLVVFVAVLAGTIGGKLIADAIINSTSSADTAMTNWMADYGENYIAVSHDVATVNTDSDSQTVTPATLRDDCVKLGTDVSTGRANPPMPIRSFAPLWSSILGDLNDGATSCVSAIDQHSSVLLTRTQDDFEQAATSYVQLAKAVEKVK